MDLKNLDLVTRKYINNLNPMVTPDDSGLS
jgi:hypothetical protein